MERVTILFGIILIILGVGAYIGTGQASVTALIPAFVGLPLVILGFLARKENLKKHAMHGAATLGLLGFLGTIRGALGIFPMLSGDEVARPTATIVQTIMCVLCAIFVGLCVRSFIMVRRQRAQQNA